MGLESLTQAPDGRRTVPETPEDWRDWVSATATRNYTLNDPLLDWLTLYGQGHGFRRDDELDDYDPRTDFSLFIMRKGVEFESAVVEHLGTLLPVVTIATGPEASRDLRAAEETFEAMRRGEACIAQAVLRDAHTRTYGRADLLVRSDHLHSLFPGAISADASTVTAPDLGDQPWHYRVLDVKFTTLHFLTGGGLQESSGSTWAYMVQVYIYNRALGRLQGYLPPEAFLIGRGWEQPVKGRKERGADCMDRLGAVPQDYSSKTRGLLSVAADEATEWTRRLRTEGETWRVTPEPSVPELRPNMSRTGDQPWHHAKRQIGLELEDLTTLWQVGVPGREAASRSGIVRWSDPGCNAAAVSVTGVSRPPILDAILDVNRSVDGPPVRPAAVRTEEAEWRPIPVLEFYVDFETVNNLDDDFAGIPQKGGQPLIFIIGCGHLEGGEWRWSCFTVDAPSEPCEAEIIDAWFAHMNVVRRRLDPAGPEPRLFHWAHAEPSSLEDAYNSAKRRHPDKSWGSPRWFDLLKRVVRAEPVVTRGAFGFGLKDVAKAMYSHGLVETDWEAGPTDGMGAMVGAWSCAQEAAQRRCTLSETDLMRDIARYNEVDCRVMMEIVSYLRREH